MTAVSKKSRIITRFRYRRADLLRQEKWRRSSLDCSGRRVACMGSFVLQPERLPLQKRCQTVRRKRKTNSRENTPSHQGKLRRAAGEARLRRSTEFLLSP